MKDGSGPDRPPGRNPEVDFKDEKRSNVTHKSSTYPQDKTVQVAAFSRNSDAKRPEKHDSTYVGRR